MNLKIIPCLLFLSACTAVNVQPLTTEHPVQRICIVKNRAVTISDFVPTIQERLQYHGVLSTVVEDNRSLDCEYQLRYTARRSWDITPYLSQAELTLWYEGKQIAKANYHLRGKGGLSLVKWASVPSKMNPVIDALLGSQAIKK